MPDGLEDYLACPYDQLSLAGGDQRLACARGHEFPVVRGIPVLLREDVSETLWVMRASLQAARCAAQRPPDDPFLDTVAISDAERQTLAQRMTNANNESVDPVASSLLWATNGNLYQSMVGSVARYPIPQFPIGEPARSVLDIGCSWGRWSLAAARQGHAVVGIDPSLGAVLAAQRIAGQFGLAPRFVVGDARHLPIRSGAFAAAYSYSVLQHFAKPEAAAALAEIGRVLQPHGTSLVQMPNGFGIRSAYHLVRRAFREGDAFEVRFYTPHALRRLFTEKVGPSRLTVDGFFGLGVRPEDRDLMRPRHRLVVDGSQALKQVTRIVPPLLNVADSLFVESTKR